MTDTTIIKIDAAYSPKGPEGQRYLATGRTIAMRLWENEPTGPEKPAVRRPYEMVGYVIAGRAELKIEGHLVLLQQGSSWVVPKNAEHNYRILESFTAVEATTRPAAVHGRDAPPES